MRNFDLKNSIQEWKELDPKEIWTWPVIPRMGVVAAIAIGVVLAGYFGLVSGKYTELDASVQKTETLKSTYKTKTEQALNLDAYKNQKDSMEKIFGELLKQLPNRSEMDGLLNDVNQAGVGRGMVFELFKPAEKEKMFEFYAELPISIKMTGSYHDFGEFSSAVANLARIVTINDINLKSDKNNLVLEATAKTFRYLDEKEVQEQKRLAAAEKAKKKGAK